MNGCGVAVKWFFYILISNNKNILNININNFINNNILNFHFMILFKYKKLIN